MKIEKYADLKIDELVGQLENSYYIIELEDFDSS